MDSNNSQPLPKSEERAARIEQALGRKKRKTAFFVGAGVVIFLALVGLGVWQGRKITEGGPGEYYSDDGQEHVSLEGGQSITYSSHPPSSGPHYFSPANWKIYDYEADDRIFIHNLEHGGIWVAYYPSLPKSVIDELEGIVREFNGIKIVMAPRSKKTEQDKDIAVLAWRRVYKFNLEGSETLTEEQKNDIRAFYKKFVNRGPESVPATMPGIDPKSLPPKS